MAAIGSPLRLPRRGPWEEVLVPEIGVPIVRVPDRLPMLADPGHVWSVAIAISALPGSTWAAPYITAFLSALRTAVNAKIDVAVFADAATHRDIKAKLREIRRTPRSMCTIQTTPSK